MSEHREGCEEVDWYNSMKRKGYDMDAWLDSLGRRHTELFS